MVHQLIDHFEHLSAIEFVLKSLPRSAFLDAMQAREIALVGNLPGDIKRRRQVLRTSHSRRFLQQSLLPKIADKGRHFALDRIWRSAEAIGQARSNLVRSATRFDLAHHRGRGGIEREYLFGACLK